MNFIRFYRYSKEISLWVIEPRLAYLCIFIILIAVFSSFYIWPSEKSIRVFGYALQLLGMILAIRGLLKIREHFGHPTLKNLLITWLQRFPKWRRDIVVPLKGGILAQTGMDAILEKWSPDNPEDTVEKRLETVIRNLNTIKDTQRTHSDRIRKLEKSHKDLKEKQKQELSKIEYKVSSELETLHTTDILLSFVGLIWITFGITMSTCSSEIWRLIE